MGLRAFQPKTLGPAVVSGPKDDELDATPGYQDEWEFLCASDAEQTEAYEEWKKAHGEELDEDDSP